MPGVIGASIFSPRPARGYRFHSLQVEIIVVPSQSRKVATNCIKMYGWQHQIPLHFKHFIVKKFRGAASSQHIADIGAVIGNCNPSTAKSDRVLPFGPSRMLMGQRPLLVTPAIITSARSAPAGAALAGSRGREEDWLTSKK